MTLATTLDRIAQLQALADPQAAARTAAAQRAAAAGATQAATTTAATATPTGFATALRTASSTGATTPMIEAARSQQGVTEQPPGSNDAPQIAAYRQATEGAPGPGPWCAYFVSWAARQAGTPLGDRGQGFGSVDAMWSWAQGAGRGVPNGPGISPQVGDVIVLDQHTGIVTGVRPDGTVETIEGNTSDRVDVRTHPAGEAIGYVRMT
ncbi:CHAP domain-containing protein [Patulibacter minatonensis]|uniref:CHAP domain-containing protein n=1 Tax=Patulibacter minatonensis TaxID=298163 RepID=UPI00068465C6|nr:CHAP domain-containing protein [Patulibacter minatonensis]